MHNLLKHALANDCRDPDCELHNLDVALEEMAVNEVNCAFWLAGFAFGIRHFADDSEFNRLINELKPLMDKAFTRTVETDLLEDR